MKAKNLLKTLVKLFSIYYADHMDVGFLIQSKIVEVLKKTYNFDIEFNEIHVEHPKNIHWGDYSTNVALKLSKILKQNPLSIAKNMSYELSLLNENQEIQENGVNFFEKIDFQAPGFINFTLSPEVLLQKALLEEINTSPVRPNMNIGHLRTKKILFEYTDPNPFKAFHIGHLMSNAIGESLSRIHVFSGAQIKRVNYQGDVGLHVAKSIWGVLKKFEDSNLSLAHLEELNLDKKIEFLGQSYAVGATAFEDSKEAQDQIKELNILIYTVAQERLIEEENWTPVIDYKKFLPENTQYDYEKIKELYFKGRAWSLEYFEQLYTLLGTKYDQYYFESLVGEYGLALVKKHLDDNDGIFEEDQGAVIFRGEKYGLHTRVFINSFGLPVYEAKDLGLAPLKYETYEYDQSFIITANEVNDYFKVVLKAMEQFDPELSEKTTHIGHGIMKFKSGKMSSRTGDIITGVDLIAQTKESILEQMAESVSSLDETFTKEERDSIANQLAIGAIKYSILRQGLEKDIIYDREHSISITGNTGPYLQYTHARANSILNKASKWKYKPSADLELHSREIEVVRHLAKFHDAVSLAVLELAPNLVCNYLFELAQKYNAFYNDVSILSAENDDLLALRLQITSQVKDVLRVGLWLLGIEAPERV